MDKHVCKLCYRSFANGRAFGGHMRSHMLNLRVPPKPEKPSEPLGEETESTQSFSSSSDEENQEEEEEEDKGLLSYGLRENPKKSIRLVDPEFSSSVVLQDRESETESLKNRPIFRRRSKRIRKSGISERFHYLTEELKMGTEFETEPPVSSMSDTTPEEDVAYSLIMLSNDKWNEERIDLQYSDDEDFGEEDDFVEKMIKVTKNSSRARGKYNCETCNRVFRSYQALGGHRASHKKNKLMNAKEQSMEETENNNNNNAGGYSTMVEEKIYECPVCFRVFSSGQALGGHKRSHVIIGSSSSATANISINNTTINSSNQAKPVTRNGENTLIDLNMPAPVDEDDEISQIELSAVSDAEFVHPLKR